MLVVELKFVIAFSKLKVEIESHVYTTLQDVGQASGRINSVSCRLTPACQLLNRMARHLSVTVTFTCFTLAYTCIHTVGYEDCFRWGGTIVKLIVLPLQCILVNICMHDQPKKWGGGGAPAPGAPASYPPDIIHTLSSVFYWVYYLLATRSYLVHPLLYIIINTKRTPPYTYSDKGLRMIVLVSLIVSLRRLLVSTIFRIVHLYITVHSVE